MPWRASADGRVSQPQWTRDPQALTLIVVIMKTKDPGKIILALALTALGAALTMAQQGGRVFSAAPPRLEGPCDVYAAAGDPCVAAHSSTRALYAGYSGP